MSTSIVIPVQHVSDEFFAMLQSLIENTESLPYSVILQNRGANEETAKAFSLLGGDVQLMDIEDSANLARSINQSLPHASGDVIVIAHSGSNFYPSWLEQLRGELTRSPIATSPDARLQALAFGLDQLRRSGGLDESLSDDAAVSSYLHSLEVAAQARQRAQSLGIPDNLFGFRVGESIADVLAAGLSGAALGDLPESSAERVRERLWQEEERRLLVAARAGRDVCWTDEGVAEPLVTIRIATHNLSLIHI